MRPTPVSVEAEMLVRSLLMLRPAPVQGPLRPARATISSIALYVHALDASRLLYGTAVVNGLVTALPEEILAPLRALHNKQAPHARAVRPVLPLKFL